MILFIVMIIIVVIVIVVLANNQITPVENRGRATSNTENRAQNITIDISFEDSVTNIGKYLIVDTETTGLPAFRNGDVSNSASWPYILQIAWILLDEEFNIVESANHYLDYKGEIPYEATRINKITKNTILEKGEPTKEILKKFALISEKTQYLVAHNVEFDVDIIHAELHRNRIKHIIGDVPVICTMKSSKSYVKATNYNGYIKNPRLSELYLKCFYPQYPNAEIGELHDAQTDVMITAKCLQHLFDKKIITDTGKINRSSRANSDTLYEGHENISGAVLKPNLSQVENKQNYFYDKKVVITGLFDKWPNRIVIAEIIQKLGADVDTGVTLRTNILICGKEAGSKKIEKMRLNINTGKDAKIINEDELIQLLKKHDFN